MTTTASTQKRVPKDERFREQLFPNAVDLVFDTLEKGFVPIPILFRKLLKHLTPPQTRVLLYLQLRASKYAICYPALDEMAHELGFSGRKKLTPHINALIAKQFISTKTSGGKKFFLLHHPTLAALHLRQTGQISAEDAFEIDDLLHDLKQQPIAWPTGGIAK